MGYFRKRECANIRMPPNSTKPRPVFSQKSSLCLLSNDIAFCSKGINSNANANFIKVDGVVRFKHLPEGFLLWQNFMQNSLTKTES